MNLRSKLPYFMTYVSGFLDTVYGITQLSLPKAKANGLKLVKLFGGCEQSGTPTPTTPVDIISNNGAIKYSINEANYISSNVTLGYWLRNSDGQPELSAPNFYTDMMPVKPNTSYVCFGRNKTTNTISNYNRIAWYTSDGTWIRNSTYTQGTVGTDTSPSNAAYARFHCNINSSTVTQELIDSYNWVFQQGTQEVPYEPFINIEGGIYTDGIVETVADNLSNTATAEMLLQVGDYQDTQEVLSGHITRNVGIKVLDGTENWQLATSTNLVQFYATNTQGIIASNISIYSTITPYGCTVATRTEYDFGCYSGGTGNLCFQMKGSATLTTVNTWTTFLADQYANGTPVIVIYPLATSTTEMVTPQTLQTQAGTNILQITQASIDNLPLEATYKKSR